MTGRRPSAAEPTDVDVDVARASSRKRGRRIIAMMLPLVPAVISLLAYGYWFHRTHPPLTGDEPCYLLEARSIVRSHDLDLSDDLVDPGGVIGYAPAIAPGQNQSCTDDFRHDGKQRPIYPVGLAAYIAPVIALTFRIDLIRYPMIASTVFFSFQLHGLLRDLFGKPTWRLWFTWGTAALTLPIIGFSNQFYPEVLGALAATVSVRCLLRAHRGISWLVAASVAASVLPWLHVRFGPIALALIVPILWRTVRGSGDDLPAVSRAAARRLGIVAAPLAISLVALAALFYHFYGSALPNAPYSGEKLGLNGPGLLSIYRFGLGTIMSPTDGLIPFTPSYILAIAGVGLMTQRLGRAASWFVACAGLYLLAIVPLGFFGYSLPGRLGVVLVPLLAVGMMCALEKAGWIILVLTAALTAGSLLVLYQGIDNYGRLLDIGRIQVPVLRHTSTWWPNFSPQTGTTHFGYNAVGARRDIGVVGGPSGTGTVVIADQTSGAGTLADGPSVEVRPGPWALRLDLAGSSDSPLNVAVDVSVIDDRDGMILANRSVRFSDLPLLAMENENPLLTFTATSHPIHVVVRKPGAGRVELGIIRGDPNGRLASLNDPIWRSIPLTLLWLGWFVALSLALRRSGRRARMPVEEPDRTLREMTTADIQVSSGEGPGRRGQSRDDLGDPRPDC